ncbi:hypothetical protein RND71_043067 [Anisodus tanguticus]|uniref:Polygalacturonase n=1 Tax=Anisodus tanguticus TaxID=243964 RepID=A0AAE1QS42_9SOLA|nr:hypothetical protein RND71_043067 [Anisodus tanguticus]
MQGDRISIFVVCITTSIILDKGLAAIFDVTTFGASGDGVLGNIIAHQNTTKWTWCENNSWLYFNGVTGLVINGTGHINGRGASWWNIIEIDPDHKTMHFNSCNDLQLNGVNLVNSSRNHISITFSKRVTISNITTIAPEDSPNTDGIDLSNSHQVQIQNSTFQTGHGISVGSLGVDATFATVENINIRNCTLLGTQNGVRIKTWQGGMGFARFIHFENIRLIDVRNPIIIDQFYCNGAHDCGIKPNAVQVSNVTYKDVFGTTASKIAVNLNCSDNSTACTNLLFQQINITSALPHQQTIAACNNAHGKNFSTLPTITCLKT